MFYFNDVWSVKVLFKLLIVLFYVKEIVVFIVGKDCKDDIVLWESVLEFFN